MVTHPELFTDLNSWLRQRRTLRSANLTIGFVPTMGALHAGHLALLARSREESDVTVLSIYVNPTQFDNKEDLKKYPATIEHDLELARTVGVSFVLLPTYKQIYPDGYRYQVTESELSEKLCGAHRPGHFDGVLTVVLKLLNLVQADRAYFGEKDFQQLTLVRGLTEAFFIDTEIVAVPTVREHDGLAMSSRNVNLPLDARNLAPLFYEALKTASTAAVAEELLIRQGFAIDYIQDIDNRRYGAVKIGGVRLIDNVER
jgi:pantoate--beta-alanine ligase